MIRIAPPGLDYFNGNVILNAKRAISDLSKSTTWGHIEKQQNLQRRVVSRVYQKTKNISDHLALLVCFVTMISKKCPKKLDHSDQN